MLMTAHVSSPRCVPCARSVPSLDLAELIVLNPTLQSRELKTRAESLPKVTELPSDRARTQIQLWSPAPHRAVQGCKYAGEGSHCGGQRPGAIGQREEDG